MAANGIPVKLLTADTDGKLTQIETPVFASARKCPALLGKIKAIAAADLAETAAGKRMKAANDRLLERPEAETDKSRADANECADKLADANAAIFNAIHDFIVAGFTGAGYTQEQAEKYASFVDAGHLAELKAVCLLGTGRLDFTKAANSAN